MSPLENASGIPSEHPLEIKGRIIRIIFLFAGVVLTICLTVLASSIVKNQVQMPYLWLLAAAFTFIAVGPYGITNEVKPGYVGMLSCWGYLLPVYVSHGTNWCPKFLGFTFDLTDVKIHVTPVSDTTKRDKNDVETKYKGIRVKWQIIDPRANKLNVNQKDLDDGICSSTNEALREDTSKSTYEKCKELTSEIEESTKIKIEKKLREERNWGINITSVEIEDVEGGEIVTKEDQEIKARDKRMRQVNKHAKQLEKRGVDPKEALEEIKVIYKIVPEEKKTNTTNDNRKFDFGENTLTALGGLFNLIKPEKKETEKKKEKK